MVVEICVGSSCHIKGAYQVIDKLQEFVRQNNLEERVLLKACFCMGRCGAGVSVRVDGERVVFLTPESCGAFTDELLEEVGR